MEVGHGHVGKWDVVCHASGNAGSEGANLFMNVVHPCVGRPASLFLDDDGIHSVEGHCHGSTGAQRVAADQVRGDAELVQSKGCHSGLEAIIDVVRGDLPWFP